VVGFLVLLILVNQNGILHPLDNKYISTGYKK